MKANLVLPTTFETDVPAKSIWHSPLTPHAQSPRALHVHTHFSPNTCINLIELCDHIEVCVIGRNNVRRGAIWMREMVVPTFGLRNHLLKKHNTLKFEASNVLKLEKVVMTNIMCLHLTLIVA